MKRIFVIIMLVSTVFFTANARGMILRTTQKFCGNDAEVVLYGGGKMSFYDSTKGSYIEGTYSLDWSTHYIALFEKDGTRAFTGTFTGGSNGTEVYTITLAGVKLTKCR